MKTNRSQCGGYTMQTAQNLRAESDTAIFPLVFGWLLGPGFAL